jgi:hypothetical protein
LLVLLQWEPGEYSPVSKVMSSSTNDSSACL